MLLLAASPTVTTDGPLPNDANHQAGLAHGNDDSDAVAPCDVVIPTFRMDRGACSLPCHRLQTVGPVKPWDGGLV